MTEALPGRAWDGAPGRPHQRGPSTVLIKNVYYMLAYAFRALETGEHRRLAAEDFEHVHDMLAAILAGGLDNQRRRGFERDYQPFSEDLTVVRSHDDGCTTLLGEAVQELGDSQTILCIEVPRRFVSEDELGTADEGAGNGDTLLLTA